MTTLEVLRGGKKEPCPYCGNDAHSVPLACPRISYITIYDDGSEVDIHFWPEEGDPDLPLAG